MSLFAEPASSMVPFVCDPAISTALATGDDIVSGQGFRSAPGGGASPKIPRQDEGWDEEGRALKHERTLLLAAIASSDAGDNIHQKIGEELASRYGRSGSSGSFPHINIRGIPSFVPMERGLVDPWSDAPDSIGLRALGAMSIHETRLTIYNQERS